MYSAIEHYVNMALYKCCILLLLLPEYKLEHEVLTMKVNQRGEERQRHHAQLSNRITHCHSFKMNTYISGQLIEIYIC